MNKIQYVWQITKQVMYRSMNPTAGDKRFTRFLWFCTGIFVLFLFACLGTASDIFAWLMDAAFALMWIAGIAAIVWRVYDIVKQMKANEHKG